MSEETTMKNQHPVSCLEFVVVLLVMQAGCAAPQPPTDVPLISGAGSYGDPMPTSTSTPDTRIQPIESSIVGAKSLDELIKNADTIVIGQMAGVGEIINTTRDVNDVTKPDQRYFGVGQVYQFRVERYLKRQGDVVIKIVQGEGLLTPNIPKTPENIEKARQASKHIPLRLGVRYLYFLSRMDREFPGQNYYVGVYHPYRFILPPTGFAVPDSQWADAIMYFPPTTSFELINDIDEKVNGRKTPTAPPP